MSVLANPGALCMHHVCHLEPGYVLGGEYCFQDTPNNFTGDHQKLRRLDCKEIDSLSISGYLNISHHERLWSENLEVCMMELAHHCVGMRALRLLFFGKFTRIV